MAIRDGTGVRTFRRFRSVNAKPTALVALGGSDSRKKKLTIYFGIKDLLVIGEMAELVMAPG